MSCLEGVVSSVERVPRSNLEQVTVRISRGKIDQPIEHFYFRIPRTDNPFMESDPVKITPQLKDQYLVQRIDDNGQPTVSYEGPGNKAA